MKFLQRFLITLLCIATISATAFARTVEEKESKRLDYKAGQLFSLENVNGSISVEGWDKNEILIEIEKIVKANGKSDADKMMSRIKVVVKEYDDEISIRTKLPNRNGNGFWGWVSGDNVSVSVRYTVKVPKDCKLDIRSTNGSVEANQINGELRFKTTNGKIHLSNIGGSVNARTTNGSISVDMVDFPTDANETLTFTTTNGSIKTYLPRSSSFDLEARTTNGSIKSDFDLNIRERDGRERRKRRKRVDTKVNGGGALMIMETTNGSIRISEN